MEIKCIRCGGSFEQKNTERTCGYYYKKKCKAKYQIKHFFHFIFNSYLCHIRRNFLNPIYQYRSI